MAQIDSPKRGSNHDVNSSGDCDLPITEGS